MSTQTELTLAERAEMAVSNLSEMILDEIQAADGRGSENSRKLILAGAIILELLNEAGIEMGPHCADIWASCGD